MSDISTDQLMEAIGEIQNLTSVPPRSSGFVRSATVGTLLGWTVAIGILVGAGMRQGISWWVIGVAAVVGAVFKYLWSRRVEPEPGENEPLTILHKQLAQIQRLEQSDPIGTRFMAILREVLSKNGMTPKAAMALIDDVAHERRSISEAFYTISAVLKQVDSRQLP